MAPKGPTKSLRHQWLPPKGSNREPMAPIGAPKCSQHLWAPPGADVCPGGGSLCLPPPLRSSTGGTMTRTCNVCAHPYSPHGISYMQCQHGDGDERAAALLCNEGIRHQVACPAL